jgi:hypothetical protein
MLVYENRGKPCDASKLGNIAKSCIDFSTPGGAEKMLPDEYHKVMKGIRDRPLDDWAAYSSYAKIFKKGES